MRAPKPVCQLDQAGVVRGGADPAPQPKPGRPERVEVAGDKGQRDGRPLRHVADDRPELLVLVRETNHVEMHHINA